MTMRKLLVANRGEIAARIIRSARELGIATVAVYSQADRLGLPVRLADEAVEIGPPQAARSYLNADALLQAAASVGADAIHPGYGFLAENADFARRVSAAGLRFVGPSADVISMMGDKAVARDTAKRAGVPTVPGSEGVVRSEEEALAVADSIGYPIMIKAAAGGGGRGIRIADDRSALASQIKLAQAEAQAAFGEGSVYLERFVPRARHIEVQILGDGQRAVHLFERECSLQRRRQKVLEEAPSPVLSAEQRETLCASAVRLAEHVGYSGAGTIEYLYDDVRREFYFIEMNTRIQVEHPVTEMVTGIDIVREMLLIAGGAPLRLQQRDITLRGAAIQCRINAENTERNFAPSLGTISALHWPGGHGMRVESQMFTGFQVPPYYDSMMAKLIAWDETRAQAIERMRGALREMQVEGICTTQSLHVALLADPQVQAAEFHTGFLEDWLAARRAAEPAA